MRKKILITGGAGYIGSRLTERLLYGNYNHDEVTVFDNQLYDKTSLLKLAEDKHFTFVRGDVRNDGELKKQVEKHDIIISLAALVGFPLCEKNPIDAELVNYRANKKICEWKSKDQVIIYPNSNSGYGSTDSGSVCTEENPMNPITLYGKTKLMAEEAICQVPNRVVLRLATVFGPSSRPRFDLLVNNLVLKALKDRIIVLYEPHFMRNYIHIRDVVDAFVHIVSHTNKSMYTRSLMDEVYNVGNDAINMTKLQLVEKIKEQIPLEIIFAEFTNDPDKRNYAISSEKFYKTGFNCNYSIEQGIWELKRVYEMLEEPWRSNY